MTHSRRKKITIIVVLSILLLLVAGFVGYEYMTNKIITKESVVTVEYGQNISTNPEDYLDMTNVKNKDKYLSNVTVEKSSDNDSDYEDIGSYVVTITKGPFNKTVQVDVKDTTAPVFNDVDEITVYEGGTIDYADKIKATDLSETSLTFDTENVDLTKAGTYTLAVTATDDSNNVSKKEVKIIVKEKPQATVVTGTSADIPERPAVVSGKPYCIMINSQLNVIMVYGIEDGKYDKLVRVITCSTGTDTPTGTFTTSDKYQWRLLFGNVYGQYATRVTGNILMHSVPYTSQSKDTLKYNEYNKLGQKASMGCIRMRVVDALWIYNNCPSGTKVVIYNSNSLGGISKPSYSKISSSSPYKNWDPTDPDSNNPWNTNQDS